MFPTVYENKITLDKKAILYQLYLCFTQFAVFLLKDTVLKKTQPTSVFDSHFCLLKKKEAYASKRRKKPCPHPDDVTPYILRIVKTHLSTVKWGFNLVEEAAHKMVTQTHQTDRDNLNIEAYN